jgi:hypothetical protein
MPNKSQNININYKFNTAEIDKLNASVAKANQATNKLQQAATTGASAITREYQKSNKTILDMNNALTRLKSIIEVTSNPVALKKLIEEYKTLKKALDDAKKSAFGLGSELKKQGTEATSLSTKFGQLYGAVQTVVGAAVVKQVVSFTLEMARLAGNTEGVERAFNRAFPNAFSLLGDLRKATRGTVTDFELMQRTLQATNLGVAVEQLPQLFEFAATRAQQTGESVDYLVDSIVRGIGRKSPLILDNLGISAIRLKEKFGGAALAAQSVGDVTKAVAEIAGEEMSKMGGFVETSATKVDQLNVAWTNLRTNLSKRIDSSGIIDFFTEAFEGGAHALKTQKEINEETAKMRAAIEFQSLGEHQLAEERMKNGKIVKTNQQDLVNAIQNEIRERIKLIETGKVELLLLKQKFDQASHTKNNTAAEINANIKIREQIVQQGLNVKANLRFYEETIKLLRAQFNGLTDIDKAQIVTIKTLRDELKALQEQREEETSIGNKPELDRLQREILLLEDRILKIADNIKWQKQWDRAREESTLAAMNQAEAEKKFDDIIEGLNKKFADGIISFSTGDLIKLSSDEKFDTDALDEAIKELAVFGEEAVKGLNEMTPEWIIRIRLGFQGKGGETSDLQKMINEELVKLRNTAIDAGTDLLHAEVDAEANALKARLKQTEDYYSEQQLLAGDNERAKKELRLKEERETAKLRNDIARKEKQAARTHILIDIATGIAKALATYPWPYALIPAAAVALQGAAQLAIVNRAPANFAEGVIDLKGPGTAKSDSIPANLSKGESIMTAWETKHANQVLKDVRARKLDDRVLRDLRGGGRQQVQVLNDERIIKAIKEQKPPDVVKIGSTLYDVRKQTETYKKRIRNSSLSI